MEARQLEDAAAPERQAPGFLDLLLTLAEWKRFILIMTLIGGLTGVVTAVLIPPEFTATAVIMPPQQPQSTATALLGQLGAFAGLAGSSLNLKSPSDLYIGILGGRTVADSLIKRFDLRRRYHCATDMDTRKALAVHSLFATGKDSLIKISVEDRDPKVAANLANAYIEELQNQNNRLAITESAQRRLFFEGQLESQKKLLAQSEVAFRSTQEQTGVLQVSAQVESVIKAVAELRAIIATREVALRSLQSGATSNNPEVIRQETELAELRAQLRKLEASNAQPESGDPFISVTRAPRSGMEYLRALRDLKYNETLFELLSKQYEIARIDEAKEATVIQVVDSAVPPDKKSWPPRAVLTLAASAGFGLLACLIALVSRRVKDPGTAAKYQRLRRIVFNNARSS
jgi:uncharacterized protein involved in exopolysaccharide biosynthesis